MTTTPGPVDPAETTPPFDLQPTVPTAIKIDPENPPTILTEPQKAIAGAVLSTLGLICAFVAGFVDQPMSGVLYGLAGLLNIIGVPWGIYVTANKVKSITIPASTR